MVDASTHRAANGAPPYFFVHVMKTAGSTFRWQLRANVGRGRLYPNWDLDPRKAAMNIPYLLGLPEERRRRIRAYSGHFPAVVTELLGEPLRTMTILREPVARTVSHLRMVCNQGAFAGWAPEAVYDHPGARSRFLGNHQTKIFAFAAEDEPVSYLQELVIDDRRLDAARARLEQIEVVGVTERFDQFLDALQRRWGFRTVVVHPQNPSSLDWSPSPSLRRRIADDVAADQELYQLACRLAART